MSTTNPLMAIAVVSCAAFAGSAYTGSDSKVMAGSLLAAPIDALVPAVSAYSGPITASTRWPSTLPPGSRSSWTMAERGYGTSGSATTTSCFF